MGNDTENVIDTLFNTLLQTFQRMQETSNEKGSKFIPDSVELLEYELQIIIIIIIIMILIVENGKFC